MSRDLHEKIKILLIVGLILFVVGALGRFANYGDTNPILDLLTPGAFHRAADTVFLFAIALALYNLCGRYLQKDASGKDGDAPKA